MEKSAIAEHVPDFVSRELCPVFDLVVLYSIAEREAIEIHKHCDLSINEKKFSLGHCNWVPALEYGKTAKPEEKSDAIG